MLRGLVPKRLDLNANEVVVRSTTSTEGRRAPEPFYLNAGHLYLTNQRVIYVGVGMFGFRRIPMRLSHITEVSRGFGWSTIKIKTRSGHQLIFSVDEPNEWVADIRGAIDRSNGGSK